MPTRRQPTGTCAGRRPPSRLSRGTRGCGPTQRGGRRVAEDTVVTQVFDPVPVVATELGQHELSVLAAERGA